MKPSVSRGDRHAASMYVYPFVERKFYGDWSPETRQLLADGDALAAYKRRAFDLYRRRFAPEALLRRVDAWTERGAPDDWQATTTA